MRRTTMARAAVFALGLAATAIVATPSGAGASTGRTLFVAPDGHNNAPCTRTRPCRTIQHAVAHAHAGDTVSVAPGNYRGQVAIDKKVAVRAEAPGTLLDATGAINGFAIGVVFDTPTSPRPNGNASGATVSGFLIENATQEGIIARGANLTISNNIVARNDRGAFAPHATGECTPEGPVPGDCGEGLHLTGVTHSVIHGNFITGNTGGMLVSDEFGPTAFNRITSNSIVNNVTDCGLTVPGHNGNALSSTGVRQPAMGGVYNNWIANNVVSANGAAGIGFFAGGPGTAVYNNTAVHNWISSNGIPGVAMHTHTPNSDLSNNRIIENTLSRNGLGDPAHGIPAGDEGTPVNRTTDIDVVADPGASPIVGTVIRGNHITNVRVGIWIVTSGHTTIFDNTYSNVNVRIKHS
jgi:hypothetical protein